WRFSQRWRAGADERGPVTARGVGVQGGLTHNQSLSATVEQVEINLPRLIRKDAQRCDSLGQVTCGRAIIFGTGADKHQQPGSDLTSGLSIDGHARPVDPLHYGAHLTRAIHAI